MENIKNKINELLEDYKIDESYLKSCLADIYGLNSRMPYYILKQVKIPSLEKSDKLWEKYGIPHQIFKTLPNYLNKANN